MQLETYRNQHTLKNKTARLVWFWAWLLLFRWTPRPLLGWRRFLLRLFGARIGRRAHIYPSARIWAPWNLEMGDHACISENVIVYCVDRIRLGDNTVVSQNVHLCTASHDYTRTDFPLTTAPITINSQAWVCADAYIGPGVEIGEGAVVGARAAVFTNVTPWTVVGGNPARKLKDRERGACRNGDSPNQETPANLQVIR